MYLPIPNCAISNSTAALPTKYCFVNHVRYAAPVPWAATNSVSISMVSLDTKPEWDAETCSSSNPGTVKLPSATPKYKGPSPKMFGVAGSEILRSI